MSSEGPPPFPENADKSSSGSPSRKLDIAGAVARAALNAYRRDITPSTPPQSCAHCPASLPLPLSLALVIGLVQHSHSFVPFSSFLCFNSTATNFCKSSVALLSVLCFSGGSPTTVLYSKCGLPCAATAAASTGPGYFQM